MDLQPQHIRHPSQLADLTVWRIIASRVPHPVLIEAEGASAERVLSWGRELSQLQSACGCEQGAFGLLAGVVGYALFLLFGAGGFGHLGRKEIWVGLGVIAVTTSVGKLFGLLAAQRRLKRVIKEIQSQWKPRDLVDQDYGSVDVGMKRTDGRVWPTHCCGGRSKASLRTLGSRHGL